jgi:hypothetical protein
VRERGSEGVCNKTRHSIHTDKIHPTPSSLSYVHTLLTYMSAWCVSRYGEASGKEQCADDFGNGLVRRWRRTRTDYCHATGPVTFPKSKSIRCHGRFIVHLLCCCVESTRVDFDAEKRVREPLTVLYCVVLCLCFCCPVLHSLLHYCITAGRHTPGGVTINPSVACFPTKQYRHGGLNDNLCLMTDVSMNVGLFGDNNRASSVISTYVSSGKK